MGTDIIGANSDNPDTKSGGIPPEPREFFLHMGDKWTVIADKHDKQGASEEVCS
jgi:hypothetical protein